MNGRRDRQRAILAIVVAVVAGLAVVVAIRPGNNDDAAGRPTIWQAITAGIHDGEVPLETALQAFSYTRQLPMPGVEIPDGDDETDVPTSGTGSLGWAAEHRDEMTPAQREVFDEYLTVGPRDSVVIINAQDAPAAIGDIEQAAPETGDTPSRGFSHMASSLLTTAAAVAQPASHPNASIPAALETRIKEELLADIVRIGGRLGLPVLRDSWILGDVELIISDKDGGNTQMETNPQYDVQTGHNVPCRVTVFKNMWSKESATGALSPTFHVVMTHEVVHCYQSFVAHQERPGTPVAGWRPYPTWISEGTAIWLAADDTQIAEPMVPGMWRTHILGRPERSLLDRSYDAFGFYALLDHLGRDVWGNMVAAWRGALSANGISTPQGFLAPLGGDHRDVQEAWGPWHLREPSWNEPWITTGFGLPGDANAPRRPAAATIDGTSDTLPGRSNAVRSVDTAEAEIVVIQTDGSASVHDQRQNSALAFTSRRFCVTGDCICPPGTDQAGERVADQDLTTPFVLAVNAPADGARYTVAARRLEDECRTQPTTTNPEGRPATTRTGPNCAGGCAMSNGDPHLLTVDGRAYDFMAAGEFVLLRTNDDTIEAHVRQEPYEGSNHVTINTSLVVRIDERRVQFDAAPGSDSIGAVAAVDGDDINVRVDGVDTEVSVPISLGDEATLTPFAGGYEIVAPDGTVFWVTGLGQYGINITVRPSAQMISGSSGILGTTTTAGAKLPALADGSAIPAPSDDNPWYSAVYGTFADSWRLTDDSSLFTYETGLTTASYTRPGFPREADLVPVDQLTDEQLAVGETACAGVDDEVLHAQCVYDAAVTGGLGFGALYVSTQHIVTSNGTPTGPADPEPSSGDDDGTPPVEQLHDIETLWGQALADDGTLYLSAEWTDGTFAVIAVDTTNAEITSRTEVDGGGTVVLAAGSVWVDGATGLGQCTLGRFAEANLEAEATITTASCQYGFGSDVVSTGDAAWWLDGSGLQPDGTGVLARRVDPATNQSEPGIAVPVGVERLAGSPAGALYATNFEGSLWCLTRGQFTQLPTPAGRAFPSASGVWILTPGGSQATFHTPDGEMTHTLDGLGTVVAVDDEAVYATDPSDWAALVRFDVDGSQNVVMTAGTVDGVNGPDQLTSDSSSSALLANGLLVQLWTRVASDGPTAYFQAAPVESP